MSNYRACAMALLLLPPMAVHADEVNSNGYTLRFEERIEEAPGDLHGETVGRISLRRTADQQLLWLENTPLRPGCGKLPAVSAINADFVSICGHLGGRHYTQKIVLTRGNFPTMASVDQYDLPSPARIAADGTLSIDVLRRDMFPEELTGPHLFPFVYRLHRDAVTFGFALSFDKDAAERYWQHYQDSRQAAHLAGVLPEMLAALLASQARQPICAELADIETALMHDDKQLDQTGARKLMLSWLQKLPGIGYPAFKQPACQHAL